MPETPSRNPANNRSLRHCAEEGLLITMVCHRCRRKVRYLAIDLCKVLSPFHQAHEPPWPCGRCGTMEYMQVRWELPPASDRAAGLTVRRPVRQIAKWIWRDERI